MKWSEDADQAIKKVPFFIRKKVRKKVEVFARQKGKHKVELVDVKELKKQFLSKGGMEKQMKGYDVSTCFGGTGCPNVACSGTQLVADIEKILEQADLFKFLKENVKGDLKFHHEFRVSVSDCPNACSRPQIVDIGIVGVSLPALSEEPCSLCHNCVDVCKEDAVSLNEGDDVPTINFDACLACGACIRECPTQTLIEKEVGFKVLMGGRLGRHPRLALEVPGIHTHDEVLDIVKKAVVFYKTNSTNGKRFSHLLSSVDQVLDLS